MTINLNPDITQDEMVRLANWARAKKLETAKRTMREAVECFSGHITKLSPGKARGTHELQRKRGGAMEMNFYRQAGDRQGVRTAVPHGAHTRPGRDPIKAGLYTFNDKAVLIPKAK